MRCRVAVYLTRQSRHLRRLRICQIKTFDEISSCEWRLGHAICPREFVSSLASLLAAAICRLRQSNIRSGERKCTSLDRLLLML